MSTPARSGPIALCVAFSTDALALTPADEAVAALAVRVASEIDQAGDLEKLGPFLLRLLESMGATPASRSKVPATAAPIEADPLAAHLASHGEGA